ncbi:hypothetical protein ACI77O_12405 [Pseudomonas tritici]|uniref:hypothetical protein n=1 Tax=Pseudomonas tritici TaxID=2745518 RepID=UPI00387B6D2A
MIASRPVADIRTEHYALIQWWWKDGYVHNSDYKEKVEVAMRRTMVEVVNELHVIDDTSLCCQWEGVQIYGVDIEKVRAAGKLLCKTLGRFKHVEFIG